MTDNTKLKPYPSWVCLDCGMKASGGRSFLCSTFHKNTCGVCGKKKNVTETRDFFHPVFKGFEKP